MYKILISGYYGFHNIGDEAVLRCVTEQIMRTIPNAELTILSQDPEDTSEKYQVRSVHRMHPLQVLRSIWNTDLLISGGGSLLQDVTGRFSILYYLAIIMIALVLRRPVFIYSQGVGPIGGKFNRFLTGRILRLVDGIAVRDTKSAQLLMDIGVPESAITITADPVLQLEKNSPVPGRQILQRIGIEPGSGRLLVGWALKSGDARFLDEVARAVRYLKETYHADSVLIPFHHEQDAKCIRQLQGILGEEAYYITEKQLIDEMLSIIGNLDLLIGVRLHSLIYASVAGVPMIGISYDPKIDAFLESVSRKSLCTVEEFTMETLCPAVDDTLKNRESILKETRAQVNMLRDRLADNDRIIRELADPPPEVKKKKRPGLIAAIGNVMLVTILAKVFGIIRESAQAAVFGTADAFYAGYNKTIYIFTTVAYAMCVAAVPVITKEMEKSRKAGERAANNLITFSLLLSVIALAAWELLSISPLSSFVYGSDGAILPFVRVMSLSLPVIVAAYLMVALFQSLDHFALQGSMSLPHSLFLIGYLMLFGNFGSIMTYVWLVCAAWGLQFAMCLPYAVKEKYRYRPCLDLRQSYIGIFTKTSLVTIITGSVYLFCYLLDASAAAKLGPGTTSAFYYADKLFTPLTTTFIYSISAVLFPKLNREYTHSDDSAYRHYVWSITENTLIVVFPVCALLMVFGGPILKVLFESGNFTPDATRHTTEIFVMYALGMAGFSVMDLVNKAFFTMNRSLPPLLISIGTVILNLILNSFFQGSGTMIALSTAISMTVGAVVSLIIMFHGTHILAPGAVLKSLMASFAAGGTAYGLKLLLVSLEDGKLLLMAKCGVIGALAALVFFLFCFILKLDSITNLIQRRK